MKQKIDYQLISNYIDIYKKYQKYQGQTTTDNI